jgi:hypothetical protein
MLKLPRAGFAPVGSLFHLQQLEQAGALGDYHLLLAHKVVSPEESEGWRALYRHIRGQERTPFVIMDNSLIELGKPVEGPVLAEACRVVDASCLVLADRLSDAVETVRLSEAMARNLEGEEIPPFLAVAQGSTLDDLYWCALQLSGIDGVEILSVPRVVTNTMGTRENAVEAVADLGLPIHLLGFSNDVVDDLECTHLPGVVGIDSGEPVRLGLLGTLWTPDVQVPSRPEGYLEDRSFSDVVIENVRRARNYLPS